MTMRTKIVIAVVGAGAVVSLNRPPAPKAVTMAKPVPLVGTGPTKSAKPVWRKKGKMSQFIIASVPATWNSTYTNAPSPYQALTFPIPRGITVSSASWSTTANVTGFPKTTAGQIWTSAPDTGNAVGESPGWGDTETNWVMTAAATAAQIADIQAAVGGTLNAWWRINGADAGIATAQVTVCTLTINGTYQPGYLNPNFGNGLIHRPMQNNAGIHQFLNVTWPNGYLGGSVDVLKLMGNMNVFYTSLKLHGGGLCYLQGNVLVVTDGSGNELADGAPCDGVDIWRIGM